jgi:cytoskeletal protein CcmA (bactofilin family)
MRLALAVALITSFFAAALAAAQTPAKNPIKTLTPEEVQQLNSGKAQTQQQGPVQNPVKDITPGQDQPPVQTQAQPQTPAQPQPQKSPVQVQTQPQAQSPTQRQLVGDDIWRAGAEINVVADNHHDVWAAGALANVRGTIARELHAAGAEVDVDTTTRGDAYVAGAIVSVTGNYGHDLYIVGARVNLNARVDGALKAGGARVLVRRQTEVRGLTQIAGADVIFAGVSHGGAEIYGDTVEIDGHIAGDLLVRARSVTVGKTAVIDGNVTFQSLNEPVIVQGAAIRGRQTVTLPHPQVNRFGAAQALFGLVFFSVAAGFMAGLVLLLLRRAVVERAVAALRARPGHSFGLGVLVFILVPVIAVLLMATVIGIPTAVLILLALPLLWLVATVIAAFTMGDFLVNRMPRPSGFFSQLWQLIVGLVVLSVIGIIPYLGFLSWLAALLVGLGAFWQALRAPAPELAAAGEALEGAAD